MKAMSAPAPSRHDFEMLLRRRGMDLPPLSIDTLQVNITKLCNQQCRHCHVDASPARREMMSAEGIAKCLEILERNPRIGTLDITGGAPELHPGFDGFVERATALGKHVMVRHNLTVQLDRHPQTGESKEYLPAFFARHRVEVVSSLPYYQQYFTDAQRGAGVIGKSIEAMRRLNAVGYGADWSGLVLNLVYHPVGPYLPAPQAALEADYKRELKAKFGLSFNRLYTLTNMPINRFKLHLEKSGQLEAYMEKLCLRPSTRRQRPRGNVPQPHQRRPRWPRLRLRLQPDAGDGRRGSRRQKASIFDFDFYSRFLRHDWSTLIVLDARRAQAAAVAVQLLK
jgi:radical SAM/Cys-rich protein